MQKLLQTILSPPLGNCFSTCLACILEMPVEDVPNFVGKHGDAWFSELRKWLEPSNLSPMFLEVSPEWPNFGPSGYSILSAEVAESSKGHCLVALDGEVVWDPAPSKMTVLSKKSWVVLSVLDPTRSIALSRLQRIDEHGKTPPNSVGDSGQRSRTKELTLDQFLEKYVLSKEEQEAWANERDRELFELYLALSSQPPKIVVPDD